MDFGGGQSPFKGATQVRQIGLREFEQNDTAEAVRHPVVWMGQPYPPLLPPGEVVDRALWLLENQPPPYRPGYRNCESIAVWCATGAFESYQAKRFMLWKTAIFTPIVFYALRRAGAVGKTLAAASLAITSQTAIPYQINRALFNHAQAYPGPGNWTPRPR